MVYEVQILVKQIEIVYVRHAFYIQQIHQNVETVKKHDVGGH